MRLVPAFVGAGHISISTRRVTIVIITFDCVPLFLYFRAILAGRLEVPWSVRSRMQRLIYPTALLTSQTTQIHPSKPSLVITLSWWRGRNDDEILYQKTFNVLCLNCSKTMTSYSVHAAYFQMQ